MHYKHYKIISLNNTCDNYWVLNILSFFITTLKLRGGIIIFKLEMNIIETDSCFKQHLGAHSAHSLRHLLRDWHLRHQAGKDQPSQLTQQQQEQQHTLLHQQRHLQHQIQIQHQQKAEEQQKHQLTSTSRRESQHHKGRTIIRMVIREEKVSIMTLDDREVIIQIFEIIMQEHPGNMSHHKWQQHAHQHHEPQHS